MTDKRCVVVTGAASGLGKSIATAFAQNGDFVFVADIDGDAAHAVAEALGGRAVQMDIADAASVQEAASAIFEHSGRVDVLINNAGIVGGRGSVVDLDLEVLRRALTVNVLGTWTVTQAIGRKMQARKAGTIINITSIGARQPTPEMGHYEASKAAIEAITRTTAIEMAPFGIRANAIAPGPVVTPMTQRLVENPDARAAWEARIPLGTIAEVDQIAPAALFLASAAASHITGTSLTIDGGQLLK
ncbi:SDR family NAD(P)-dependent oxidoreductase [Cognatishimia sp. SS12]|uniref:SDR family NAD(P)-dependent oxidoreductase n=1 Tax=Cognatishimia sp. SS12 TaxID=2979465 RepID=UPI00232D86DA|nr:SDR family oxidoreductase [Cognatishimia sp. SS12]MDC0739379.1 SDR family NAD(P)-dependent oxidoreductase [Cognatishimia sp. SS12]